MTLTQRVPAAMSTNRPTLIVGMVLVGGWMLNLPGGVYLVPIVVFAALIAANVVRLSLITWLGFGIAACLFVSASDERAIAFAIMFALLVSISSISRPAILRGLDVLLPVGLATAMFAWWQELTTGERALGLLDLNPNATAGFLLVAAVWTLSQREYVQKMHMPRMIAVAVMLTAIAPTGSRWGLICAVLVILAMTLLRHVKPRTAVLVLAPLLVVTGVSVAFDIGEMARLTKPVTTEYVSDRAYGNDGFSLFGHGYQGNDGADPHNLFIRAYSEAGALGFGLLCLAVALAFHGGDARLRWMLATLLVLGMLDYYVWGPFQLAPLLWMTMGAAHGR